MKKIEINIIILICINVYLEMSSKKLIFSTVAYEPLANDLISLSLASALFEKGEVERRQFADGENYLRILSPVRTRDAVIIGGTVSDEDTLELYDFACGLVASGVHRLWIVIPYYGYSTMERSVNPGEVVKAKTRARLLSSIPLPGSGSQVVMLDLHVDSVAHYFEGSLQPVHIQGKDILLDMIRSLARALSPNGDYVLASTDAGRAKQVEKLANILKVPASFVFKKRNDDGSTEVTAVSAGVRDKHVIIYDDMIRTGGSLINAARAYKDAGAAYISVVSTHGIFAGNAVERLKNCGLIDVVKVTDSHSNARKKESAFVRVTSIAPMLADFLSQ
jgi:ribose-phosphate pyrophosphokinase